jgi:hypothetical protein
MSGGLVSEPETDLIEAIRNGLPPGVELDEREETLLSLAAQQARDVERAEADLEERGYLVPGSQGQQVVNPSLSEARQGRVVLGRFARSAGPARVNQGRREERQTRR